SPHHLASAAAVEVMNRGGNAADAVIAADAVLGMVLPTTCGIGGDLFALVHRPGWDQPEVLNASGRGGSGLDPARLRAAGHTATMPYRAPETVTVPGCVDGWVALAERHGTAPLGGLHLDAAIALGRDGFEVSKEFASDLKVIHPMVGGQPSAAALYPDGSPPAQGTVLRRPDLAATLEAIRDGGRDAFYNGAVAAQIAAATGGVLTTADLAANHPDWVDPVGAEVLGLEAWTVPPNSQGYLTVAAAMLLERLDPTGDPTDPAFHHAVIEAYRAVAWERDDLVADARFAPMAIDRLLDPERLLPRLANLRPDTVARWPQPAPAPGGTAYFCAVDAAGMAVSCIQSNFAGIGSGLSAGTTGVFLHNRGAGFTLIPGHPNEAAPGKRPLHTLSPSLWTRHGRPALILGTRGGHQQPQYLLQMAALLRLCGLDPATAQATPRWHADAVDGTASAIAVEARTPDAVVSGLRTRGHDVTTGPDLPQGWGPVSVIAIEADGTRHAAADPRVSTATAIGA
ncbi:MAG TPA: gamma-glutamyltransferase, partial [Acidimicrobiia bacterium]|nr:gamma-glutamyltransferase [Acidimicrobiia bacterium]